MEKNNQEEKEVNQQKDMNEIVNQESAPVNQEDETRNNKSQISNYPNIQQKITNNQNYQQSDIQNQNINIQEQDNFLQNNLNQEIQENSKVNNEMINNMQNMNPQINPQSQQINDNIMYQMHQMNVQQNNQELPINTYMPNQLTPEQLQYQQQMEQRENKNIYDYETNKNLYGISFQNGNCPRLAISSLEKSLDNKIEILELVDNDLQKVCEQSLEYPCTKLLWSPNSKNSILAQSSDCVQLYKYSEDNYKLIPQGKLLNKKSKYCGALTSFDWNTVNDALLGTASVDTTCTIWDLNKLSIKTQLIAHDKEVFDIKFGNDENTFISGGADGSVRLFDLRALNHSTIIYETRGSSPINKLAWNLQTYNLIAALSLDKNIIYIFDSRLNSNVSMDELNLHKEPVTGIVWAPDNPMQLCSVSEDCNVIISNVHNEQMSSNTTVSYNAPCPINNVDWCKSFPEWIGITFQNKVQLLRK